MKQWTQKNSESGFTLIEVVITITVTTFVIVGILGANIFVQHMTEAAFERTIAVQEAHQVIEDMRDLTSTIRKYPGDLIAAFPNNMARPGFRNLTALCGPNASPANACTWPFAFTPDGTSQEQVVVNYTDTNGNGSFLDEDPLDVTVTVIWKERGFQLGGIDRPARAVLRTFIRRRPV